MVTFILCVIYLAFISLGLPDGMLGSAWPTMRLDFDKPLGFAGFVSFTISLGTIISSFYSVRLLKKFGTGLVTAVSVSLTAVGLLGFAFTPSYWWLFLFAIPLGLGAGCVDSGLNEYVAEHYKAIHMNFLHCFWGIGALCGPLIMSSFIQNAASWRPSYLSVAVFQCVLVVILFFAVPAWNKTENRTKTKLSIETKTAENCANQETEVKTKTSEPKTLVQSFKIKGVKPVLVCFMLYTAMESTLGLWGASYLTGIKNFTPAKAAAWVSLFYTGITVGRGLCGFLSLKLNNKSLIRLGVCNALFASALLMLGFFFRLGNVPTLLGFVLFGLGCAPIFPAMLHETPVRFGKEDAAQIMGFQMAVAYTSITIVPPTFGLIATATTPAILPFALALFSVIMFLCTELCNRIFAKKNYSSPFQQ